jgi:hypothetical protein
MSPLSRDPEARSRQIANLRRGGPVQPGNRHTVTHGAYARITQAELDAEVRELMDAIGEDLPVREADGGVPAADVILLEMLAGNRIQRRRVRESEVRHGIEERDGGLRPVVGLGVTLDNQALRYLEQLGMSPRSRAALKLDLVRAETAGDRLEAHLAKNYADADGEVIEDG